MELGYRKYKSASLRLAEPCLPEDFDWPEGYLEDIREILDVTAGNQRKGHATALLKNVCAEADVEGKVLMLQVRAFDDGAGNEVLERWYSNMGFKVIQTEPALLMSRVPQ